jgi:hypothetical protein
MVKKSLSLFDLRSFNLDAVFGSITRRTSPTSAATLLETSPLRITKDLGAVVAG